MRETTIRRAYADGRAAYPGVSLTFEAFKSHCQALLGDVEEKSGWGRHGKELYLCCGCVLGDPEARLMFEREILPAAAEAIARTNPNAEFVDDTLLGLQQKLLAAPDPKLAQYSAGGSLLAWTMVVATRYALQQLRAQKSALAKHTELAERLVREHFDGDALSSAGAEAHVFQKALGEAVQSLPSRERNILRMHLLGRCNVDQISRAYSVERATAARWLSSTKDLLFESVRGHLRGEQPEMTEEQFRHVAELVRSQLDLTFAGCGAGSLGSSSNR